MLRQFRRCKSSSFPAETVTSILSELNIIQAPKNKIAINKMTEVEMVYGKLVRQLQDPSKFNDKLAKQISIYNFQSNHKLLFYLLNKIDFMNRDPPSMNVYNQIFVSLLNMSRMRNSAPLAHFALQLVDECSKQGLELDDQSFKSLDTIIASSDILQHQQMYLQLSQKYNHFSSKYLLQSGQYERCVDLLKEKWLSNNSAELLKDFKIHQLIMLALKRLDYNQVLEFLKMCQKSSILVDNGIWARTINDCTLDGHYELTLYCYDEYIKDNISSFSISRLLRICEVFALQGKTDKVLELMDFIRIAFKIKMDSKMLSIVLESYCNAENYKVAWVKLNQVDIKLNKYDFENLISYYPTSRYVTNLLKAIDHVLAMRLNQELKDIIFFTILKKLHNVANMTGMSQMLSKLHSTGNADQILKNYEIILHSISKSNSSKICSLKFYQLLQQHNIKLSPKNYYYLLKNSLFSNGADNYTLTKYFTQQQLQHYGDLSPNQLRILQSITNDDQIQTFLQLYLSTRLEENPDLLDYKKLLPYDLNVVLQPHYLSRDPHLINNYHLLHDIENAELFDILMR